MNRLGSAAAALALALLLAAQPSSAAHYCTAATGTFMVIPLPANPVVPERAAIYIHDRARTTGTGMTGNPLDPEDDTEGTWIYLENGKKPGYQPGGAHITGLYYDDCGGNPGPNPDGDDVIL